MLDLARVKVAGIAVEFGNASLPCPMPSTHPLAAPMKGKHNNMEPWTLAMQQKVTHTVGVKMPLWAVTFLDERKSPK